MIDAFDVFQLCILSVYAALLVGRTVQLYLRYGINPFVLGSGKSGIPALLERILFPALAVWAAETVLYALHSPLRIFPRPLDIRLLEGAACDIAGAAMLLCACGLFAWALVSFGASWRVGIDTQNPGSLATGGVFAVSRNPIFLSIDLYFIGAFLLNGSVFFLAAAILAVVMMHLQILREERHLLDRYGEEYRTYCGATRRYFGRTIPGSVIRNGKATR
jgi:protein-S-isoprenylcysteine O-methyltransferase Ste14